MSAGCFVRTDLFMQYGHNVDIYDLWTETIIVDTERL